MNLKNLALALLSGILLAIAFPTFEFHLLIWVALVPLFFALRGKTSKDGFWLGGITGIVFFTGTVSWVTNSVHSYGGIPLIPASLITLLLCAYLAFYLAIFGAASSQFKKNYPAIFFLIMPALWTALELARTYVFSGFPWSLLGYSQYRVLPIIQFADITGVYGVSFLIVLVNASIADFLMDRRKYVGLIASLMIVLLVLTYGSAKLNKPENGAGMTIAVIQGNIEQDKKWDPSYQAETISVYKRLTRTAITHRPDLVIWPETATPFYFTGARENDRKLTSDLMTFVKQNQVALLFGSPTFEITPDRTILGRNSVFLLSPEGAIVGTYHKMHLVPFGEYVPLKKVFFFVDKLVAAIGDFQAGDDYAVMPIPVEKPDQQRSAMLGTVICYEIIFPDLVRHFVKHGASIIATVTNDAWFGVSAAPYQHFSMAVFRAVENRVPVARAANTGISGFIDSKGHILQTSKIFTACYLTHAIRPGTEKTFYTSYGDLFSYACLVFCVLMLALTFRPSTVDQSKLKSKKSHP
jgi:apolipoprotein N-acyltransferase